MKKLIWIIFLLFFTTQVKALDLSSQNIVLYNMNENKVIYERNKDEKTSIASLTKIMTTLVAIENIQDYNETIQLNERMFTGLKEANAAVIGLKNGQIVTYNDLLYGMFLASGADATRAIAISIAGSEEVFVQFMNQKAKQLGMNHTNFANTTGLDENNQYSTVNDIAILLKNALNNEKFKEIFVTESYRFTDGSFTVYSTFRKTANQYKYNVDYIEGAKTGFTNQAGKCLASYAIDSQNNIKYLLVTTNAPTLTNDAYHVKDAVTIYEYYFNHYKYHTLVSKGNLILTLPTKYGKEKNIEIYAKEDIAYYLNNDFNQNQVKLNYIGTNIITTNMKKGTKLGQMEIIYYDEILDTFDVYLPKKVDFSIFAFLKENKNYVIAGICILLTILFLIWKWKNHIK